MYHIYLYQDYDKTKFFDFLKFEAINSNDPAATNMWDKTNSENSLIYILENTERFNLINGEFHIVTFNDEIVACGGVYQSDFSKDIGIAGTRAWITKKFRNKHILREILLPCHKSWCIKNNYKAVAICFNEYNKNLITVFKRTRLGESSQRVNYKEPKHLFFNGIQEVAFPINIQHTKQWLIYEKLDPNFSFDWNSIRYVP
jgi:hypothetical protein